MTSACLQHWIGHPEELNKDTLDELRLVLDRYPYFQSVRLLYLKNLFLLHDSRFGDELRRSVLYVADRRMLFRLIEGQPAGWNTDAVAVSEKENGEEPGIDRTLSLIDAYLAAVPVEKQPSQIGLDYSVDYTAYLMRDEAGGVEEYEAPKLRGQELIDGFIRENEQGSKPSGEKKSPYGATGDIPVEAVGKQQEPLSPALSEQQEELDDSYFTETLAKIYIKQHRYEKALEIIKKLSLNYPKKNAYFADQIKTLEELIINAKSK